VAVAVSQPIPLLHHVLVLRVHLGHRAVLKLEQRPVVHLRLRRLRRRRRRRRRRGLVARWKFLGGGGGIRLHRGSLRRALLLPLAALLLDRGARICR
jgi:hypothetical protein